MPSGAISSLLSTLPEMWRWTTAGLQYQAAGGEAQPGRLKPPLAWTRAGMARTPAVPAPEKPWSSLAKRGKVQPRSDGRSGSDGGHRPGSLPVNLFILLPAQIENFGLTEYPAKVLVSGQKGSGLLKKCR